ncbi:hypothetical protein SAMN06272737_14012 [Blastococcus mobilis]|uniref:Uncharacterized protein n=2 Tax=Blastococcus mobilis TaxID=1938746 RepID=A0A239AA00_9ACTN|nr:hypothetical protein SAMN06272737_14012 [Blastococcus mobilis]
MARRNLCSHAHAVSYEPKPKAPFNPWADTPFFCEVMNHTAANQVDNGVCPAFPVGRAPDEARPARRLRLWRAGSPRVDTDDPELRMVLR